MLVNQWSSTTAAPRDQFGFVRDMLLGTPVPIRLERPGVPMTQAFRSAAASHVYGPDIAAVHSMGEAAAGFRGVPEIARGAPAMTWVLQYRVSSGVMMLDGQPYSVRAGDILYGDCGVRQFGHGAEYVEFTMWLAPTAWFRPLLSCPDDTPVGHLRRSSALGRLASSYLANLGPALDEVPPDSAALLMRNLFALLAIDRGVSPHEVEPARGALADVRLEDLRRFIRRHYREPDLDPTRIAAHHGLSLRALHLLFEPGGTSCARFILETRLDAAMALLRTPVPSARTIADIAFACGFESLSTFHRTFRNRYGHSPAEIRSGGR